MDATREMEWLAGARVGEAWALERFYEAHHAAIFALCRRLLTRPEDAEDAMQAAFVHAFRALPRFEGRCAVKTWLYRIAVNEAIDLLRKRAAAPLPLEAEVAAADGAPDVAERVAVQTALSRLRPDHRIVLVLRFWEDLSYQEMASVLGVTLPTVKMRLSRAKAEFLRAYEDRKP